MPVLSLQVLAEFQLLILNVEIGFAVCQHHISNIFVDDIFHSLLSFISGWSIAQKLRPCLDIDSIPNPNYELYNHICKLGAVRKALPALKYGNFRNVNIKNEQLVYMREYDGQTVYVALNLSDSDFNIDINSAGGVLTDALTGDKFNTDGYTQIPLKPCSSRILVLNDGSFELDIDEDIIPIENNVNEVSDEDILEPIPVKLGKYRHFKGNEYEVIAIAKDSETLEELVVYRALYGEGEVWVRNKANFEEIVERDGKRIRRFTRIENGKLRSKR